MFYRYLQEYNRTFVNKRKKQDCPLEISLEDRMNVVDQFFEVYEPQDNDGRKLPIWFNVDATIEEKFQKIHSKLSLHIQNIEDQIQANSQTSETPTRTEITQLQEAPPIIPRRFSQRDSTVGYNELMRQSESEFVQSSGQTVSDSERQLFRAKLQSFKKNLNECIVSPFPRSDGQSRPENALFLSTQLEQVEREVKDMGRC